MQKNNKPKLKLQEKAQEMQKSQFKLESLALILQSQGEYSRKYDFLSVSLSKIGFWPFSLSSPSKWLLCPLLYPRICALAGQDNVFSLQQEVFSLQRVGMGCSVGSLIMRILVAANLVFATASMCFAAVSFTFAASITLYLDLLYASIFQAFWHRFMHFHGLCIL